MEFIYYSKDKTILSEKEPRVTVVGELNNNTLRMAVARCSLNDRFERKIGREIAKYRLLRGDYVLEYNGSGITNETFYDLAKTLVPHIRKRYVAKLKY